MPTRRHAPFGRYWQPYVAAYLDPKRERIAAESLHELPGDLAENFFDIGCGSGCSRCAHGARANVVVSLDVDSDAVAAWGVLHHTGDMYIAVPNSAAPVKPGGKLATAISNRVMDRFWNSRRWWHIKCAYDHSPRPVQAAVEWAFRAACVLRRLRKRQNPVRLVRGYQQRSRGMARWTDQVDWLGGSPYEFATADEITDFCERSCGLRLLRLLTVNRVDTGTTSLCSNARRPDR